MDAAMHPGKNEGLEGNENQTYFHDSKGEARLRGKKD